MSHAPLVFDIETVGESYEALDEVTQQSLTRWLRAEAKDEIAFERGLETVKERMGFSPLVGQIVAIGVMDAISGRGAVYYQSPEPVETIEEDGIKYEPMTEAEMLAKFWDVAKHGHLLISFNGRAFDAPFLNVRSAVHGIRPSVDLMEGRYLYQQKRAPKHIDLLDQLSYYGAVQRKGNLHLWCRAFGIPSPKAEGITGDDVQCLFEAGKTLEIARYNVGDLRATAELYQKWHDLLNFQSF